MATKKTEKKTDAEIIEAAGKPLTEALAPPVAATSTDIVTATADEFSADQETLTADDLMISRFRCVQPMTRAKKHNKELKDGQIYSTLTKKGFDEALVVAVHETHHIVERTDDSQGKFISTMALNDPRVVAARKANGQSLIKLKSIKNDTPTKYVETRDIHVIFLDPKDGLTALGFGVLQFDSTNLTPAKIWKNERNAISKGSPKGMPSYAFRTVVKTTDKDNSASGQPDSKIYDLSPYKGNWKDGAIAFSFLNGETTSVSKAEYKFLQNCQEHKKLLMSGAFKVEQSDEEEPSEDEAEDSSFDPDDDGRETVSASPAQAGSDDFV